MRHKVTFNIHDWTVPSKDIIFNVKSEGKKFGEIKISRGGVEWVPRSGKKGYTMRWTKFDEVMLTNGRKKR